MNNDKKKGVIIFGGHVQGYGILKIYGKNNIPGIIIDSNRFNIARHSKYCRKFIQCNYENLLNFLLNLSKDNQYKNWLLLPTDDYYVRILSENKKELENYYNVTVDNWDVINLFFNKRFSYPLAKNMGVPIPVTHIPDKLDDIKSLSKQITFPCIVKPAIMLDFYRFFKQKVFVCNNKDELLDNINKAKTIIPIKQLIIQEIIPGSSENQYSVGMFFNVDKSFNSLVARRKRQHPLDFGNATTFAETVDIPILIDYSHKILSESKFTGLCEVEFKYDERDQEYKFLEVNPRTWKWHLISESANIPFLLSLYNFYTKSKPIIKKDYVKAGWQDFVIDIPIISRMLLKNIFIKSDVKNINQAVFDVNDIKPFLYQIISLPYNFLKR